MQNQLQNPLKLLSAGILTALLLPAVARPSTLILVDKKKNELSVAEYAPDRYRVIKTFPTTLGQVTGDKWEESDLKTPEGIYTLTSKLTPPMLKAKFGVMAFYMDYPNAWDRLAGRNGFDIMLHATDEPDRLKKTYDSEGCVVVSNEQLQELAPYVQVGLTPILVFEELTQEYAAPAEDGELRRFFEGWREAWEKKNLSAYIDGYHPGFTSSGRSKEAWRSYKGSLNDRYGRIQVAAKNIRYLRHPKMHWVVFEQDYRSFTKAGKPAYISQGTKTLLVARDQGELKIIEERFTPRVW